MTNSRHFGNRFKLNFNRDSFQRIIAAKEIVLHCHHYNARLQNAIESVSQLDGKKIISSSAEAVFSEQIANLLLAGDTTEDKWRIAGELYAHLGYGLLDLGEFEQGIVYGLSSHFVEGWSICFGDVNRPICTFTEGYIQAMIHAITGEVVFAREVECMHQGASQCKFVIEPSRREAFTENLKHDFQFRPVDRGRYLKSPYIDENRIINALVDLPIQGNEEGLIPQFNVYLASTPADFYNQVCIRFIEEMGKINRLNSARRLLLFCAEICGLTTFRGIMNSPEWESLIEPMIHQGSDRLLAIIAVSNGLGWGNWHVLSHEPGVSVQMQSLNGYEAIGYRHYRSEAKAPQCLMFTGVSAGIMELLYGKGTVEERYGTFASDELQCICCGEDSCRFEATVI